MCKLPGRRHFGIVAALFLLALIPLYAQNEPAKKTILVLHSYNSEYRWTADINDGALEVLQAQHATTYLVCVEYLDWLRFPDEGNIDLIRELFRKKYRNVPINVIIASDDKALAFAVENRKELFSDAPVVFTGVFPEQVEKLTGGARNVTGVFEEQDIRSTVLIALGVQKKPQAAYTLSDLSKSGQDVEKKVRDMILRLAPGIPVVSLSRLTIANIETFTATLTQKDLVFIGSYSVDTSGMAYTGETLIGRVCKASNTPVYVLNTHQLGTGALGGRLLSPLRLGENAGALALRILGGEPADSIAPLSASSCRDKFDWNAVKRFGINTAKLPKDSIFLNREETFFSKYKREVTGIIVIFIILFTALNVSMFNYRKARILASDLGEKNEEITQLNDTLSQSEEELRQQFTEITIIKENLEESEKRYRLASIGSNDAIWDKVHPSGKTHFSGRWFEMTGYDPEKNADFKIGDLVHPADLDTFKTAFREHLDGKTDYVSIETRIRTASGDFKWVLIRCKGIPDENGETVRFAGSVTDIDDRKNKEAEIESLAYYDQLTSLPNRTLGIEITRKALIANGMDRHCGLIFINIDNFKHINDTYGHPVGDKVLKKTAEILATLVNENIHLARFSGDEFTLLVEDTTPEQVEKYGKLAITLLGRKMDIDGRYHYLTASAGTALYPDHASTIGELFQNADAALHRAKLAGKTHFFQYNSAIQQELLDNMELETNLRTALENNEIFVAYQPQINLASRSISGVEALARWNNPRLGNISPAHFIPIAERTGMIDGIGLFVLTQAAKFIKRAENAGYHGFTVSINVSVMQLHNEEFVQKIIRIVKSLDVGTDRIALEITESFLIDELGPVLARLNELKQAGFKLSLDDFGKGYSSLSYLRTLPLDYIKIDKCFIDDIVAHGDAVPLAKSIIALSHQLGLKVVAEGVEVKEQLDYLRENGCDYIQGYYYSKPGSEESVLKQINLSYT